MASAKIGQLVSEYLQAKEAASEAAAKLDTAKAALGTAMGDLQETTTSGFKITYKRSFKLDSCTVKKDNRYAWEQCLKPATLDVTVFRKKYPELAERLEQPSGKPVLKVSII